ncbi:dipeptidase [Shouchella sp. JSM 1781072]|uniref:dipeptidase n=1 Tax=Bacillaceae TaxID=186817 RepID=UPI0020D0C586|nr:dipeptidase [Alkalihalobacillus sp. LMS6]UTR04651.1 dipeptidase [Alkalihalobacillus sp. LMS6]
MKVIDTHCDALLKLWKQPSLSFEDGALDTNIQNLKKGRVQVQFFAIWIPDTVPMEDKFSVVQRQVNQFYERVLSHPQMVHLRSLADIEQLKENEIGAVLTVEGMDAVGHDVGKVQWLYEQGVLSIGLTWNGTNACADGIGEKRGAGLTAFGEEILALNNEHQIINDVSHLSIAAFWDVLPRSRLTIASHSNSYTVCPHDRNLRDDQIKALIKKDAFIGIVFFPKFTKDETGATIQDLLTHIDYIGSLGGIQHIGFGSDFDGINQHIEGLENASKFPHLLEQLSRYYSDQELNGFCSENFKQKVVAKIKPEL